MEVGAGRFFCRADRSCLAAEGSRIKDGFRHDGHSATFTSTTSSLRGMF